MDWSTKDVFTTGEAAEVCRVSQQTIIRCFDAGRLTGFKVPGSKFRRIPRDELLRFMRANSIPTDAIETAPVMRIMLVSSDHRLQESIRLALTGDPQLKERTSLLLATSALAAGLDAITTRPGMIILSQDVPGLEMEPALHRLAGLDPPPVLVCAVSSPSDSVNAALRAAGAAAIISLTDRSEAIVTSLSAFVRQPVSENGE
ncbi:MAG: helix-turn-helix domain-containing protein [Phycisphaerales bacterium]|nr:helix-turn-helix domain-containing protein [Phycisphaerales bacterium]